MKKKIRTTKQAATLPLITASAFIRQQPFDVPAAEVVTRARRRGLPAMSAHYVHEVRSQSRKAARARALTRVTLQRAALAARDALAATRPSATPAVSIGPAPHDHDEVIWPADLPAVRSASEQEFARVVIDIGVVAARDVLAAFERDADAALSA